MQRPTHRRNKTGEKVRVDRVGSPPTAVLVVYASNGRVLGSYESLQMQKFHKRYTPLRKLPKGR